MYLVLPTLAWHFYCVLECSVIVDNGLVAIIRYTFDDYVFVVKLHEKHACTHTQTHTHMHTHTHSHTHTCTHAHMHTHAHILTYLCTHVFTHR